MRSNSLALLALLAARAAHAAWPVPNGEAYADTSLCTFELADAAGKTHRFDFASSVDLPPVSFVTDSPGYYQTFLTSLCHPGRVETLCVPQSYDVSTPLSSAMLFWGEAPACNTSAPECFNPLTNEPMCCTSSCEPLAQGPPTWTLLDPTDAASGGLRADFWPVPTAGTDPFRCPLDAHTGVAQGRNLTLRMLCDPNLPEDQPYVVAAREARTCQYNITIIAAQACGKPAKTPSPPLPAPAEPPSYPPAPGTPAQPNQCSPLLTDSSGEQVAFRELAAAASELLVINSTTGATFVISPCGVMAAGTAGQGEGSPQTFCLPPYPVSFTYASSIIFFGDEPQPDAQCFSPYTQTYGNCTRDCEAIAVSAPLWVLADPDDGEAGGLVATFAGASSPPGNAFSCPYDPATGMAYLYTLTLTLACDASLPAAAGIVLDSVVEQPACTYAVKGRAAAACGTRVAA